MRKIFGILAFVAAAFGFAACEQNTVDEPGTVVIYDGPVDLVDQGFGMYYGDKNHNSLGVYSVVLSDAVCFRDGFGDPYLDSEGDMLVLEFLAPIDAEYEFAGLPVGEYQITSDETVTPRVNTKNSYVKRLSGTVQYQYALESGSIKVSKNAQGTYDVETKDLVISKGSERHDIYYSYSGAIKIDEWSKVAADIQDLKADVVDMPFPYVSPVYYGNLFGYGTGNYVVTLATDGFMEDESGTVPGVAVILNMFGELVPGGDTPILLKEGTYTVYPEFNYNEFSMLYGLNMDGVPFGTYLAQVDKNGTQSVEFISGGTVEVTRESVNYEDVYTLKYSLNAPARKVTGTWVGKLDFLDASEGSGRVILSTLDGDVACDMSKVERGHMAHVETLKTTYNPVDIAEAWQLWLEPRMWTDEEMELPFEERVKAWDPNGDIMILEFVVPLQTRGDIAPEKNKVYKYTIQPNLSMEDPLYQVSVSKMGRPYDDIFYQPFWNDYTFMTGTDARRGFTWDGGYRGNWYLHYIPGTWQNMDEMAPAVKGTVSVTRTSDYVELADGREANFNIVWDLYDDAEASYNITGEWSGPVTLYN